MLILFGLDPQLINQIASSAALPAVSIRLNPATASKPRAVHYINLQPFHHHKSLRLPSDLGFFDLTRCLDNKHPIEYFPVRHPGPDPAGHSFSLDSFDFLRLVTQSANLVKKIATFKERNKIKDRKVIPMYRIGFTSKKGRCVSGSLDLMTDRFKDLLDLTAED